MPNLVELQGLEEHTPMVGSAVIMVVAKGKLTLSLTWKTSFRMRNCPENTAEQISVPEALTLVKNTLQITKVREEVQ